MFNPCVLDNYNPQLQLWTDVSKVRPKFATGDENLLLVHLREG